MNSTLKRQKLKIFGICVAIFLTVFTIILVPIYSWFSTNEVTVYAPITTDTSLFIGAGHEEDIKYLSFEGIDVTKGDVNEKYNEYVFSVSGEFIDAYKIQLAYTTNNQFELELYAATETANISVSDIGNYDVVYYGSDGTYYGYTRGAKINGVFENNVSSSLIAKDNDSYFTSTYGSYAYVNKYAIPLYWHTSSSINVPHDHQFPHYYILRIITENKDANDRETDIICISAKADYISQGD